MLDVQWCKSAVTKLGESRWQTFRLAAQFTEALDDARAIWQDRAGREIDNRFFLPHDEETQAWKVGVESHAQCLTESTDAMGEADKLIKRLGDGSLKLRATIRTLDEDIEEVYSQLNIASRSGSEAAAKISQTRQLLASL